MSHGAVGHIFNCGVENGVCVTGTYPDLKSDVHFYNCTPSHEDSGCIVIHKRCPLGQYYNKHLMQCLLANGGYYMKCLLANGNGLISSVC